MTRWHFIWSVLCSAYVIVRGYSITRIMLNFVNQLTVMGMKHQEDAIALQAIEFWSTVCETETEYAWEAAEVRVLNMRQSKYANFLTGSRVR